MKEHEYIIRDMAVSDIQSVVEIEELCFSRPWSPESFVHEINENKLARYKVVEINGVVAAYAGFWLIFDEGHITNVAVHPDFRKRGIGMGLMHTVMQAAADEGVTWMTLEVRRSNIAAQALYKKLGFTGVGYRKRYYEDNNEDALIMCCEYENMPKAQTDK